MNFKLLAIRPLKDTSSELLKGLKDNFLYRFYNEYHFLDKNGNNIINDGKHVEVGSISYLPTVPNDLYGNNINISAIVGQNGSGKSTLLEIFYYFLFEYSRTEGLLSNDSDLVEIDSKKIHIEFYYLLNDEIYCIEWDNVNNFIKTRYQHDTYNQRFDINSETESFENGNKLEFPIYNIVTNYSIYGLNSNSDSDKWLDNLFIKNDGYQTPIVLNPYREEGNININREFELANSRLLKVFLTTKSEADNFNTSNLIKDVSVNKLLFKLNIDKNLNVFFNDQDYEIDKLIDEFTLLNKYSIKDFYNKLYNCFNVNIKFRELIFLYDKIDFLKTNTLYDNCFDLSNLYIFKKIVKIVRNYKNYKKFENIFKEVKFGNLETNANLKINFSTKYAKLFLIDQNTNLDSIKALEHSKGRTYKIERLKEIENHLLKYYYNFYYEDFINEVYSKYEINRVNKKTIYEAINYFLEQIESLLNSLEMRHLLIDKLLAKLSEDKSHVTLKIRQVLNMQHSNFFNNLNVVDRKNLSVNDGERIVYYTLDKNYIYDNNSLDIEYIPNAFFEPIFMFIKSKENHPFELKYLSSGEQQMLHSTISISYHLDNLLSIVENEGSVENSRLRTYRNINIILDEIELYYHPELQRNYIENLIVLLSQDKYKEFNFNIIFSTHSPFILSDIPSENVLKLVSGEPKPNDIVNSFSANIYDLLNDEFFLKNGAVGAYAQNFINSLIDEIEAINPDIEKNVINQLKSKISIVGDELVQYGLEEHLFEKLKSPEFEIELLKERIKNLEAKNVNNEEN